MFLQIESFWKLLLKIVSKSPYLCKIFQLGGKKKFSRKWRLLKFVIFQQNLTALSFFWIRKVAKAQE